MTQQELMQKSRQEANRPSCFLKLSQIQTQLERVEKMLYSIKGTLNFKEACLYTGLSDSQLYKLVQSGKIPHYKPGGKLIYFNKLELEEWLCRNKQECRK